MKKIILSLTLLFCMLLGVAQSYNVTFSVDMNTAPSGFFTPAVSGNFNGWCGACAQMADVDLDGIWDLTIAIDAGTYEYKFTYDDWAGQENLTSGSSCTITTDGFTNRTLTVDSDIILNTVCWESCLACGVMPPVYNVTFQVDMNNVTDPFTTPEVNGTFNAWCGGCAPMTDENLDGVWELTVSLEEGNYEYKFAYDSWAGQENLTSGSACTITTDGFTNRTLSKIFLTGPGVISEFVFVISFFK